MRFPLWKSLSRLRGSDVQLDPQFWGGCPLCAGNDGYCSTGRVQWCYCHRHAVRWCRGENMVSDWRHESPAQQRERYAKIQDYRLVQPVYCTCDQGVTTDGVPAHITAALWNILAYVWDEEQHESRDGDRCTEPILESFRTVKAWLELVDGSRR